MMHSFRDALAQMPDDLFANERVLFRPVRTEDDLAYAVIVCRLTEEQQELVNPAGFSIGRAYLKPQDNYPCVICSTDGKPVGFIHFLRWLGAGDGTSWSYYIDCREQGRGYGKAAASLAVQVLKAAFPAEMIKIAVEKDNTRAQTLYRSLGFQKLDELDGDDLVFGLS